MSRQQTIPPTFALENLVWAFRAVPDLLVGKERLEGPEVQHLYFLLTELTQRLADVHRQIVTEHGSLLRQHGGEKAKRAG